MLKLIKMVDNSVIEKYQADLANMASQFDNGFFPTQDWYENYERTILMYANEMAQKQWEFADNKLLYDKIYIQALDENKNKKVLNKKGEEVDMTQAEAERQTDLQLLDNTQGIKKYEILTKKYQTILDNYRRFGEVIKSRLIKDMADQKRQDTVMNRKEDNLPF